MSTKTVPLLLVALLLVGCQDTPEETEMEVTVETYPTIGSVERLDPALEAADGGNRF